MNGTNDTTPTVAQTLAPLIATAISIRDGLKTAVTQLNLALENESDKRRTAKELRQMYDEAEAEFIAEVMPNLTGKNAESRKAELDAAFVAARRDGTLANLWAQSTAAAYDAEDAKVGLDQCAKSFHATEAAANLTAAILNAAAK
jgi:hypothetical protein